jgi:heat-inducible transcriptional repressor
MLTSRRSELLGYIVRDYVDTAVPVGSQSVVQKHGVPYSPATVRLEMGRLEEEGYISQPHTSAGRVPSAKGYRYYVESLMEEEDLTREEQATMRHQFHQAQRILEEWFQLAAALLARTSGNFSVVTAPRSRETRLRRVQLVALHEFSVLCIAVLQEARVRQQVLLLREPMTQEMLDDVAQRLNRRCGGLSLEEVSALAPPASAFEEMAMGAVREMMEQDALTLGEMFRDGVKDVLSQPEFANTERILDLIDALDERSLGESLPLRRLSGRETGVFIGEENAHQALRDCSVVVAAYGTAGGPGGVVALIGPTRMRYERNIPRVRYLAELLTTLSAQL